MDKFTPIPKNSKPISRRIDDKDRTYNLKFGSANVTMILIRSPKVF